MHREIWLDRSFYQPKERGKLRYVEQKAEITVKHVGVPCTMDSGKSESMVAIRSLAFCFLCYCWLFPDHQLLWWSLYWQNRKSQWILWPQHWLTYLMHQALNQGSWSPLIRSLWPWLWKAEKKDRISAVLGENLPETWGLMLHFK